MTLRLGRLAILLALSVALFVTAYLLINTTFMMYDDEGYLLLSYKNFIAGERLYDDIFSQYGPWPYVYHLAVSKLLQSPINHMVGRNLTAIHWVLCALLTGAIASRLTGQKIYGLFATLITFGLLWQMTNEPSHPGSLICVLLTLGTFLIINAHKSERWNVLGAAIGLITGLLLFTKINIGGLFLAGAGVAALRLTIWPEFWQKSAAILSAIGLLVIPWALMGSNLHETWILIWAIQFTLSAAGLLWVAPVGRSTCRIPARTWSVSAAVFFGTLLVVSSVVIARGTTLPALLESVFVRPLRHPANFIIGFTWQPNVWPVAAGCGLLVARAGWELRYRGALGKNIRVALLSVRLAVVGLFIFNFQAWLSLTGVNRFAVYCLPLLPAFLVQLRRSTLMQNSVGEPLVFWTACLALPQVLHAYPVAGSQISWGTFLLLPVFVAGVHDTWEYIAELWSGHGRWLTQAARTALILVGIAQLALLLHTGWNRYQTSKPFELQGAENIRAGDHARLIERILTMNTMVHADVLFSRQGMFSYNLWSGVPTPTAQNATHWFWLLNPPAQAAIIDRLSHIPRSAIITGDAFDDFLAEHHVPVACPLQTYIAAHYRSLFVLEGFHFQVPLTSRAVPFGRVEVLYSNPDSGAEAAALLQTNVVLNGQLASAQLQEIEAPWQTREDYSPEHDRLVLQPITAQGEHWGETITLPHSQPLHGLFQLSIYASRAPKLGRKNSLVLVGLDAGGRSLSESAF